MVRIISPEKLIHTVKQPRKTTQKNTNIFTIFVQKLHAFLRTIDIFLHKKRTLKGTWKQICDFFKETAAEKSKEPKTWFEKNQFVIWDSIMLLLVYLFLFSGLKMEWFLRDIIPIGGDVPYHFANYIDFKEILIPHFQFSGWSDASFGGFQLFQSYPIFPFVLIYILDLFMGSGVAFKAILILGVVGLPLATYWTLFQSKVARPGPIFGAILSLAYLFHDDHFAFGGNLRSIFSGEFAHSFSILLLVLFCGFLYKAFENKKYIPHAALLLALIGFSHPVTFAVAIFLPLGFLISHSPDSDDSTEKTPIETLGFWQKSSVAFRVMLIGGLLFSVWAIGYYVNRKYSLETSGLMTNTYGWGLTFNILIPKLLFPFALGCLGIIIYSIFFPERVSLLQKIFLWGVLISLGFFLLKFMGFAIRFLPLVYLFSMLFIATTLGEAYRRRESETFRFILCCIIIASAVFIAYFVGKNSLFQRYQGTSGHNFIGAESREEWRSVQLTSEFLSKNFDTQTKSSTTSNPPRVFSYFKGDLFRVTSRASLYDSLFSHSPLASLGIWTGRQIDKETITVKKFWDYMSLNNIKIVIAPEKLAQYLDGTTYFSLLQIFDQYKIFETTSTSRSYVVPLKNKIYTMSDLAAWKSISKKWYESYTSESPFVVYNKTATASSPFLEGYSSEIPPVPYEEDCEVQEFVQRGNIRIHTNCIGRPLLIKFAYHQNWQVIGAKKVYLATPAFMIVVPEENTVTLYYGKRPYNFLAYACGLLGIFLLLAPSYLEKTSNYFIKKISDNLQKNGNTFFNECSTVILYTLSLILLIAFVYANKG